MPGKPSYGHVNPSMSQAGFRGRNDDGSQTAATWKAAENTGWTQAVDENFRVRFVVDETAGGAENIQCKLQYNLNVAGWNDVNATSLVVRSSASANFAEGDATTRQLTSGTGTFVAGKMDEADGATNVNVVFAGGELTEFEFCAQVRSADVVNNDSIQLRLVRAAGTVLESYVQTPTVTVSEAGGVDQLGSATLAGAATVSVIGVIDYAASSSISGTASITAIATVNTTHFGAATLSGTAVVSAAGSTPVYVYSDYESYLQFDTTKYGTITAVFESIFKTTGPEDARARLFNVTDAVPVTGGQLQTASTSFVRSRTGALTLTGTKEYKAQAGVVSGSTTTIKSARLVVNT